MKTRTIELSTDNRAAVMVLPINPPEIEFTAPQLNQRITLLNIGEVNLLGNRGLITGSLSSFFPSPTSPLYRYADREPQEYLRLLEKWKNNKTLVRVIVSDSDFNLMMTIENLPTRRREGDQDIYYTIELAEYRKLNVPAVQEASAVQDNGLKDRPNTKTAPAEYTVVKGDTLWKIAVRLFGDGAKYKSIYASNQALIGANPNLIQPGQRLVIPT